MRAERPGSYSIVTTVAGMPCLSRLKSIARSLRLLPPPRKRMVMSPELRRPPDRILPSTSGLCGFDEVMSSVVTERAVAQRLRCRSVSFNRHI